MSRIRVNSIKPISGEIVSLSGSLIVTGDVIAEQFITEKVNTSIIYRSGSTLFGDSADDNHNFTGSVLVNGGLDSNLRITLGDDILLKKGVNGGGLLEVLPTDTEGLHGIQLAAETTSTNIAYSKYYDNKLSISEAGREGVVGTNGQHIKLQDIYRVQSGVPTRYAGIEINHPSSSRFRLGLGLEEETSLDFSVKGDSRFLGSLSVTGSTNITGSTGVEGTLIVSGDITSNSNIKTENGTLHIEGYTNVSESIARLDHFSSSLDDYYATDAQLDSVSSSLAIETAHLLSFSSSFDNIYASEAELYSATASLDTRIISLEGFSSSLDATYATDAQLSIVSESLASSISGNGADLISVSSSILSTIGILSSSLDTRVITNYSQSQDNLTAINSNIGNISGLTGVQNILVASTGSYAHKSNISGSFTLLSASIAQSWTNNHNDIHDLEQDAYTFQTSASIQLNYVSKANLRAALTGSTNYNDFTGSLLALLS